MIKRRLRDALALSLSHHERLVTSRSRVLQRRHEGRSVKTAPQERDVPHIPSLRSLSFDWIYDRPGIHKETTRSCFNQARHSHRNSGKVTQRGMGPEAMRVLTFRQFVLRNDSNSLPPIIHAKSCSACRALSAGRAGLLYICLR